MTADSLEVYDAIIIGSGFSGCSTALALVERGHKVLMLEAGVKIERFDTKTTFIDSVNQNEIWKHLYGRDISPILNSTTVRSPKLKTHLGKSVQRQAQSKTTITENYDAITPKNVGGLSVIWGANLQRFSDGELIKNGIPPDEISPIYDFFEKKIGLNSNSKIVDVPKLTPLASSILKNFNTKQTNQFTITKTNNAINQDWSSKTACVGCGMCLFGCSNGSLFEAAHLLFELKSYTNFRLVTNAHVLRYEERKNSVSISCKDGRTFDAQYICIAAGTISSLSLLVASEKLTGISLPILNNPTMASIYGDFSYLGSGIPENCHSLSQLTLQHFSDSQRYITSIYDAGTLPSSLLITQLPFTPKVNLLLARLIAPALAIAVTSLPGENSDNAISVCKNGDLKIRGNHSLGCQNEFKRQKIKVSKCLTTLGLRPIPRTLNILPPGADFHPAGWAKGLPSCNRVDNDGRLLSRSRIFFVDSSIIRHLPSAHLTFTTMANAYRIGQKISKLFLRT